MEQTTISARSARGIARASVRPGAIVTGASAIAAELGVSTATVFRMIAGKRLKAFRTGDHTSPWKVWRSEIERIRDGARLRDA